VRHAPEGCSVSINVKTIAAVMLCGALLACAAPAVTASPTRSVAPTQLVTPSSAPTATPSPSTTATPVAIVNPSPTPVPTLAVPPGPVASEPYAGPFVPAVIAFDSPTHGVVAGAVGFGSGAGIVGVTNDGGRTWRLRRLATPELDAVTVFGSLILASTPCVDDEPLGCEPSLIRSTDGGTTWQAEATLGFDLDHPFALDAQHIWATDAVSGLQPAFLATSADGGRTWLRGPSPCPATWVPQQVGFTDPQHGWLACIGLYAASMDAKGLMVTSDGGKTWTTRLWLDGSESPTEANDVLYNSPLLGIEFAPGGWGWWDNFSGFYTTADAGRTWHLLGFDGNVPNAAATAAPYVLSAVRFSATDGLALITANQVKNPQAMVVEATHDGGRTWSVRTTWPWTPAL